MTNLSKYIPKGKHKLAVFLSLIILITAIFMFYVYVYRTTTPPEQLPPPIGGE